eukprot:CAMPEP_0197006738 /NCGR_PEP_ID=MMETSP1380-20130617/36767_1 /TAXON_ID=5936 /ORGANISM="Euplotes crassus, Strain CT5" /LENGTH=289 /DNA_ID=CAMNT_0042426453 /DNA_START=165 /DNA_END=1034 /DNA_ORIENTATION=+
MPCTKSVKQFILDGADAIDELLNDQTWTGTISVAEVLGGTSFIARNCTYSVDELSGQLYNYLQAFPTFESWTSMVRENVARNMVKLSLLSMQIVDEIKMTNPDFPLLGSMVGELVYYTLERETAEHVLRYLRQDPLAPSPLNKYLWATMESAFEFLKNSQVLTEEKLVNCHNNVANMLVFQSDAFHNFAASVPDEGIYLTLDSFVFLKSVLLECYDAGHQIGTNFDKVYKKIGENPDLVRTNFESELFYTLSDSIATYSQIYYRDIVGMNRILGDLVYRTLVKEQEVEN